MHVQSPLEYKVKQYVVWGIGSGFLAIWGMGYGLQAHLPHALCSLPGDVNQLVHLKVSLPVVEMLVQGGVITPLSNDGELRQHRPAHIEENIGMPGFSEGKKTIEISTELS